MALEGLAYVGLVDVQLTLILRAFLGKDNIGCHGGRSWDM
jgi:hypothetical protein